MSGTITNGQVAMPAGILKFLAGSGIDSAMIFAQRIQKNYGILEVKGLYKGFFVKLLEVYERILLSDQWKSFTEDLASVEGLEGKLSVLTGWAEELGLLTPEQQRAFNFFRHFLSKVEERIDSAGELLSALVQSMEKAGVLKEGVGTGDLVGFARSLEIGKPCREEKKRFMSKTE